MAKRTLPALFAVLRRLSRTTFVMMQWDGDNIPDELIRHDRRDGLRIGRVRISCDHDEDHARWEVTLVPDSPAGVVGGDIVQETGATLGEALRSALREYRIDNPLKSRKTWPRKQVTA